MLTVTVAEVFEFSKLYDDLISSIEEFVTDERLISCLFRLKKRRTCRGSSIEKIVKCTVAKVADCFR